jgi:outer membrane lipoprotein-sorting protein
VIRISHPKQRDGLQFFQANMYVDSKLHVPVRIDAYGWPEQPGQERPLLAEYTYTNLKLNVDLSDSLFEPAILRSR